MQPVTGLLGLADSGRTGGTAPLASLQENPLACEIPDILAIEPDPERAGALTRMVHDSIDAKVIVSASADVAVSIMARRMPDLILLSAFTRPGDERTIVDFLRQANRYVPVLIISPMAEPWLEQTTPSRLPWLSRRRSQPPKELVRDGLAARLHEALERSRRRLDHPSYLFELARELAQPAGASVSRAHRWPAGDVSWLSGVKLASGVMGQVMNISNSGLLVASELAMMPGNVVTFELCPQHGGATEPAEPGFDVFVPAHIVRSEVSKIGGGRLQYLVAARFNRHLEILADRPAADAGAAPPAPHEPPGSAGGGLNDLSRALEGLQQTVARMSSQGEPARG